MVELTFHGETNQGKVRTNNEDNFVAQWIWDDWHLLAVAIDGVGGYEGGEVAAEVARKTIISYFEQHPQDKCLEQLKLAAAAANNAIMEAKMQSSKLSQMGCVLTAGLFELDRMCLNMVHVGDSRLYQYSKGELRKLSHDHSLVGYREELGELTEEEAMCHPQRNMVERMMGDQWHEADDENFLEASIFPLPQNAQYVFCSDGLTDMITSKAIVAELERPLSVEERAHQLIQRALDAGGKDNVTVVLVEVNGEKTHPLTAPSQGEENTPTKPKAQPNDGVTTPLHCKEGKGEGYQSGVSTFLHWRVGLMVLLLLILGFVGGYIYADWKAHEVIVKQEQEMQQRDALIQQLRNALQKQNEKKLTPQSLPVREESGEGSANQQVDKHE